MSKTITFSETRDVARDHVVEGRRGRKKPLHAPAIFACLPILSPGQDKDGPCVMCNKNYSFISVIALDCHPRLNLHARDHQVSLSHAIERRQSLPSHRACLVLVTDWHVLPRKPSALNLHAEADQDTDDEGILAGREGPESLPRLACVSLSPHFPFGSFEVLDRRRSFRSAPGSLSIFPRRLLLHDPRLPPF